jgi:hypothetical protein
MRKYMGICLVLSLLFALVVLMGCAMKTTPVGNATDLKSVDFSKPMKEGQACGIKFLTFGPFGDTSIMKATKNAGISKVEVVDIKSAWYLIYSEECLVVYGH